jgi:hypothetical protein
MSTRQNDPAPRSRLRSPAAIVLVLFIMVSGYFWGRQFNARDIQQRDSAILQLQSDSQRLAADIADQNANLTALRAELTSTKASLDAIMPSAWIGAAGRPAVTPITFALKRSANSRATRNAGSLPCSRSRYTISDR